MSMSSVAIVSCSKHSTSVSRQRGESVHAISRSSTARAASRHAMRSKPASSRLPSRCAITSRGSTSDSARASSAVPRAVAPEPQREHDRRGDAPQQHAQQRALDAARAHSGGPMLMCSLKPEFSPSRTGTARSSRICPTGDSQRSPSPALW